MNLDHPSLCCRQILFHQLQSLSEKVAHEESPALLFHLVAVVLFQQHVGTMVNAPGSCVPALVEQLKGIVGAEAHTLLVEYQQAVVAVLRAAGGAAATTTTTDVDADTNNSNDVLRETNALLLDRMPQLKALVSRAPSQEQ